MLIIKVSRKELYVYRKIDKSVTETYQWMKQVYCDDGAWSNSKWRRLCFQAFGASNPSYVARISRNWYLLWGNEPRHRSLFMSPFLYKKRNVNHQPHPVLRWPCFVQLFSTTKTQIALNGNRYIDLNSIKSFLYFMHFQQNSYNFT